MGHDEWAGLRRLRKHAKLSAAGACGIFFVLLVMELVPWPKTDRNLVLLRLIMYIAVVLAALLLLARSARGCIEQGQFRCPACGGSYATFWSVSTRQCRTCNAVLPRLRA